MLLIQEFSLSIDYSQVVVCLASCENVGLIWTDEHVSQGFAWAEGVVSFGIPDHDGECLLQVFRRADFPIAQRAIWAVQVPFKITEAIGIGTVFDCKFFNLEQGQYNLILESEEGVDDYAFIIKLYFMPVEEPSFAILKSGGQVVSDKVLCQKAELAMPHG